MLLTMSYYKLPMEVWLMQAGESSPQNPPELHFSVAPHTHLRRELKEQFHLIHSTLLFNPTTILQLLGFLLTWQEQTEHLSFSSTQIWPLCLILSSWIQSPVQFLPWGHRQSYPPSKLKQIVSLAQLCLPVPHSSMSAKTRHVMLLDHI